LLPSRRELQPEEFLHALLSSDQFELKVSLIVTTNDLSGPRKKQSQKFEASSVAMVPSACLESHPNPIAPTSANMVTIIKLSFQDHHRRLPFEHQAGNASYACLTDSCTQFFGVKNIHRMVLSYQDEDGDRVQLSTNAELAYALDHYAEKSAANGNIPVLRLRFSVKSPPVLQIPSAIAVPPVVSEDESKSNPLPIQRRIQDGDVIVLQAQREGVLLNLAYCKKDQKVIAARQPQAANSAEKMFFRKNAQWVVEKCDNALADPLETANEDKIFFLSCQMLRQEKAHSHLRVYPNGSANHEGGRGLWARFVITSHNDGQVTLRSVGRSKNHPENNFLGIAKNNAQQFVVAGDLNENSDNAKFTLHFV